MNITILYFASLAMTTQKSQEQLTIADDTSLTKLYELLQTKYGFELNQADLRVAVNDVFAKWGTDLNDGDTVAFIPPVAGG